MKKLFLYDLLEINYKKYYKSIDCYFKFLVLMMCLQKMILHSNKIKTTDKFMQIYTNKDKLN